MHRLHATSPTHQALASSDSPLPFPKRLCQDFLISFKVVSETFTILSPSSSHFTYAHVCVMYVCMFLCRSEDKLSSLIFLYCLFTEAEFLAECGAHQSASRLVLGSLSLLPAHAAAMPALFWGPEHR